MSTRAAHGLRYALAVIAGHLEAIVTRLDYWTRIAVASPRWREEARGDRCPLCGHQLGALERRPPRDTRTVRGQLKRLPEEVLSWRRCGGCERYQHGVLR